MKQLFANRLKRARTMAGLSMDNLAERVGVSKEAISKYEKAKVQPNSDNLIKLCTALNVKIDYFFRAESFEMKNVEFRKKSSLGQKKLAQLKEIIKDQLERYLELEQLMVLELNFKNPIKDVVIGDFNDIEQAANLLHNQWQLGLNPINNVIELLEDNGVKVIENDAEIKFDGLSSWVNNHIPLVVVNKNFPIERKRFTLMHELGHLLLALPKGINHKQEEAYCNRFAGAMLMPEESARVEFGVNRNRFFLPELIALQKEWGLSIRALLYRANDLDIITKNRLLPFYKRCNYDKSFREDIDKVRFIGDEESNRFSQLLYRALAQGIITTSKAAALSNTSVSDIKSTITVI